MSIRSEWRFQFTAHDIAMAAADEAGYHKQRATWWKAEQDDAIEVAETAGVQVRKHDVTGGKRVDVVLDPSVAARLNECERKITEHQRAYDEYQRWAEALGSMPNEQRYDLDSEDVAYFRLATRNGRNDVDVAGGHSAARLATLEPNS